VHFAAVAFEPVDIAAGFRRRALELEIVLIETGDRLQPLDIEQSESTTVPPSSPAFR
jgi:hypothetical protein